MPLTKKGAKLKKKFKEEYGPEKGEQVFFASANKGTIKGVEKKGAKKKSGKSASKKSFHGYHTVKGR